jgi:hypothetical protein
LLIFSDIDDISFYLKIQKFEVLVYLFIYFESNKNKNLNYLLFYRINRQKPFKQ